MGGVLIARPAARRPPTAPSVPKPAGDGTGRNRPLAISKQATVKSVILCAESRCVRAGERTFLASCPQCRAWSMAASGQPRWPPREMIFRCPRCGHQATARGTPTALRGRAASASFSVRASGTPDDPFDVSTGRVPRPIPAKGHWLSKEVLGGLVLTDDGLQRIAIDRERVRTFVETDASG
jgi:hypothetical protein